MKLTPIRRMISALVAVAMLVTMLPATLAASVDSFVDFPTGWSAAAMTFAVDNGLINGKENGRIEPEANLTRAEMAAIINRAFGAQTTADISAFSDVSQSEWYYTEMQKAVQMQTFTGDSDGTLRPNDNITREEVMAVLARALVIENSDFSPISGAFSDAASVSEWARPYISAIITNGYVNGYEDGTVRPLNLITREEFVQLMYNIFKTFITAQGDYHLVADNGCVMINTPGVVLEGVTVNGDLVLGDGVGSGTVYLKNITIKGRLLARGGNISLINVTTGGGVVVKNVNGETHFNNYKTEPVFTGVRELTYTTYKTAGTVIPGGGGSGGGGGGGGTTTTKYDYTVNYYFENVNDDGYTVDASKRFTGTAAAGTTVNADTKTYTGFKLNDEKSIKSLVISSSGANTLNVYYDRERYNVKVTSPGKTSEDKTFKYEQTPKDLNIAMSDKYTDAEGGEYQVEWRFKDSSNVVKEISDTDKITSAGEIYAVLFAKVEFDLNYDNAPSIEPIYVELGTASKEQFPADPSRNGYVFKGWYSERNGTGAKFYDESQIDKPIKLYAYWTKSSEPSNEHTVTFVYNDGTTNKKEVKVNHNAMVAPLVPTPRAGYTFAGWYTDESFSNDKKFDFSTKITADIILYAKWEIEKCTVNFYIAAGWHNRQKVGEINDIPVGSAVPYNEVYKLYDDFKNDPDVDDWYYIFYDGIEGYYDEELGKYHMINAEYRYLDDNGKWQIFATLKNDGTNADIATKVTKNMDVEFTFKYVLADPSFSVFGIDISDIRPKVPYSSTTRLFDSIKDGMKISRNTIANGLGRKDEDGKTVKDKLYAKLAQRGGLIDEEGNLLIKKFNLKIADVIDTNDIKKQVNSYITELIKGNREDMKRVLDLIDIESIVNEIGARKLIDVIGYDGIKDAIKDESNRDKLIDYIRKELAGNADLRKELIEDDTFIERMLDNIDNPQDAIADELLTNNELIIAILGSDVKDALIDKAAENSEFMNKLLSDPDFKEKVISIVRGDKAEDLLDIINNSEEVRADIISLIKDNEEFKEFIKNNDDFRNEITEVIKGDDALKAILKGDGKFKKDVITKIKAQEDYKPFRNDMINALVDDAFRRDIVDRLKDNSDFRSEVIAAITARVEHDVSAKYDEYIDNYVNGDAALEEDVKNEIDKKIDSVIKDYLNNTPKSWDGRIDSYVGEHEDSYISDAITKYADDTIEPELKNYIDAYLPKYIIEAVDDYMKSTSSDEEVDKVIDNAIISYVNKYLKKYEIAESLTRIIDDTVVSYIKDYITGKKDVNEEIKNYAEAVKDEFIIDIKNTDVSEIQGYIIDYVKDKSNEAVIRDFVNNNYNTIKDYIIKNRVKNKTVYNYIDKMIADKAATIDEEIINDYLNKNLASMLDDGKFISEYIDKHSDEELKELVLTYADANTIADYIEEIKADDEANGTDKLQEFIDSAIDILNGMTAYNEFMDCFIKKYDSFPVNKDNVQFAKGVSEAIKGFSYDDIVEILRNKGYGTLIDIVGEDEFKNIFEESKEEYCSGLDEITAQVENDSTVSATYTTSMNVKLDAVGILNDMFDKYSHKLKERLAGVDKYFYDQNKALQSLVEDVEFEDFLDYDETKKDDTHSGYSIRDFMAYYDYVLEKLIVLDKALLFYGELNDDEYRLFKQEIADDIAAAINRFDQMIKDIENGDEIAKGKTLDDIIAKINSLKSVVDKLDGTKLDGYTEQMKTVIDDVNSILRKMGDTGELPLGYTLDDLLRLSARLRELTQNLTDEEYERFNEEASDLIARACNKMFEIIYELDKDGTIRGTSLDDLVSKVSFIENFYKKYNDKIDSLVHKFAGSDAPRTLDPDTIKKYLDSKRIEDILVGEDVKKGDTFNLDGAFDLIVPKIDGLKTDNPTDTSEKEYVDTYRKESGDNSLSISRYFQ